MSHQNVNDWIKFASYTSGRDKVNRLVQYSCRLVIWYAQAKDAAGASNSQTMAKLKSLEAAVSLSRKLFRMGNSVEFAQRALVAATGGAGSDPAVKFLSVLSNGGKSGWLLLDHILWAAKLRLIDADVPRLTAWSARLWFLGCLAAALLDLYRLMAAVEELRRLSGDKTATRRRIHNLRMELLRDSCDMLIPLTLLNRVNPGLGWLAGVVSSVASLKLEWRRLVAA